MTTTAKVFVVVNLVLAVLTFGAAGALLGAQNDYKMELKTQRQTATQKENDLQSKIDKLNTEIQSKMQQVSEAVAAQNSAQTEADSFKNQLASAKTANDKLTSTNETLAKNVTALQQVVDKDRTVMEDAKKSQEEAVKNALAYRQQLQQETARRADLEAQLASANDQTKGLSAQLGDVQAKLRDCEFWLSKAKEQGFRVGAASTGSAGRVIAVDGNLVSISVGSEDNVKMGDNYNLYRGSSYVGQIKIIKVMKSMAVGEFDTQYPGSGAPPQVDDTANPGNK